MPCVRRAWQVRSSEASRLLRSSHSGGGGTAALALPSGCTPSSSPSIQVLLPKPAWALMCQEALPGELAQASGRVLCACCSSSWAAGSAAAGAAAGSRKLAAEEAGLAAPPALAGAQRGDSAALVGSLRPSRSRCSWPPGKGSLRSPPAGPSLPLPPTAAVCAACWRRSSARSAAPAGRDAWGMEGCEGRACPCPTVLLHHSITAAPAPASPAAPDSV